jgi:hypothetical protein
LTEKKLNALLQSLRKAQKLYDYKKGTVYFCIDCMKTYDEDWREHFYHTTTFTDCDHDGIGEWISALEWVRKEVLKS